MMTVNGNHCPSTYLWTICLQGPTSNIECYKGGFVLTMVQELSGTEGATSIVEYFQIEVNGSIIKSFNRNCNKYVLADYVTETKEEKQNKLPTVFLTF